MILRKIGPNFNTMINIRLIWTVKNPTKKFHIPIPYGITPNQV